MPAVCSEEQIMDFLSNDFPLFEDMVIVGGACKEKEDLSVLEPIDIATMWVIYFF